MHLIYARKPFGSIRFHVRSYSRRAAMCAWGEGERNRKEQGVVFGFHHVIWIANFSFFLFPLLSFFSLFSVRFSLTPAAGVAGTAGTAASRQIMNRYANEQAFLFSSFLFFFSYKAAGEIHQTNGNKKKTFLGFPAHCRCRRNNNSTSLFSPSSFLLLLASVENEENRMRKTNLLSRLFSTVFTCI